MPPESTLKVLKDGRIGLIHSEFKTPFTLSWTDTRIRARVKAGSGRRSAIARACGLKPGVDPYILDAAAGFGIDGLSLALMGCRVHMLERNSTVFQLLDQALREAVEDRDYSSKINKRLTAVRCDFLSKELKLPFIPEVVYLDPMFPEKKKRAQSKKGMQILHDLVGADADSHLLLEKGLKTASKRVVVKRPVRADALGGLKPDTAILTKMNRFDIYLIRENRNS